MAGVRQLSCSMARVVFKSSRHISRRHRLKYNLNNSWAGYRSASSSVVTKVNSRVRKPFWCTRWRTMRTTGWGHQRPLLWSQQLRGHVGFTPQEQRITGAQLLEALAKVHPAGETIDASHQVSPPAVSPMEHHKQTISTITRQNVAWLKLPGQVHQQTGFGGLETAGSSRQ